MRDHTKVRYYEIDHANNQIIIHNHDFTSMSIECNTTDIKAVKRLYSGLTLRRKR